MPLYIKDREVDAMAEHLARIRNVTKTEAVRRALASALDRERARPSLVDIGVAFGRDLRAKGNAAAGRPVDKAFRDSLYEGD